MMKEIVKRGSVSKGEVYWVEMDPSVGTEVKKTRPAIIITHNGINKLGLRYIIAPLTSSQNDPYFFEIPISFNNIFGKVMLDQIRTIYPNE
jgi:mRNA interferase MazF